MQVYRYASAFLATCIGVLVMVAEQTQSPQMPCVEVQIGQDTASRLNCLNDELRRKAEQGHNNAALPQVPLTAQSESNKVGTFNDVAARQKMGSAYGVSAQPQRPKSVFTSPLLPSAKH